MDESTENNGSQHNDGIAEYGVEDLDEEALEECRGMAQKSAQKQSVLSTSKKASFGGKSTPGMTQMRP